MRTLTFSRNIGSFIAGETYDIENNITANYFISNNFATEEIVSEKGCVGCKPVEEIEPVEAKKQSKK